MRVKITKSVHLNDIAGETRRMIDDIKNRLMYRMPDEMSKIVRASLSNIGAEYFLTIDLIDNFRKELALLDENLLEAQSIIQGYRDAIMPPSDDSEDELVDEESLENEVAEHEKKMSREDRADEGFDEEG